MAQVLEAPWNGIVIEGGFPNTGVPDGSANVFAFLENHNTKRVRVYMDPRIVMPFGTTTIPSGVQTQLTAIATAARANVPGQAVLTSQIEWALVGCTEPTSATASRRPWVSWMENFWEKADDLLGSLPATWGYAILSSPTVQELAQANADPDASMTAFTSRSWGATELPYLNAGPWLEAAMTEVVDHLRGAGCTKNIIVPTIYYPGQTIEQCHPGGTWIDDDTVWYEAVVTPMGINGFHVTKGYTGYNTDAQALDETYRPLWYESAYFTQQTGSSPVLDALDLTPPDWVDIADEVALSAPSQPITDLVVTALNLGADVSWTAPTDFGDGLFLHYFVQVDTYEWRTSETSIQVGPFVNDTEITVTVGVVTTIGASELVTDTVTPLSTAPDPDGEFPPTFTGDDPVEPPITQPQPLVNAFPEARNFRPSNWLLTPDEVEEGY